MPAVAASTVLLIASVYQLYDYGLRRISDEHYERLSGIAAIKAGQIVHWRRGHAESVERMARRPLFREALLAWRDAGFDPADRPAWENQLRFEVRTEYPEVILVGPDGRTVLASTRPGATLDQHSLSAITLALQTSKPVLSEIFRDPAGRDLLDAVAQVEGDAGQALAVLVFRIDPREYLFPLVELWPADSPTAETHLVRQEADAVEYVSPLRHRPRDASALRLPITRDDLPSVQAMRGEGGRIEGSDYRGAPVLSDVRRIHGSSWWMVAKVDRSEILGEARQRTAGIFAFAGLALVATTGAGAYVLHRRRTALYRKLYEAERRQRVEREQFRAILYSLGDAVITTGPDERIEVMNAVASRLCGWPEQDARGRSLADVFVAVQAASRHRIPCPARLVLQGGEPEAGGEDTLLIARDATERPIALSAAPIRDASGAITGAVLVFRDQTQERAAQRALRDSEARFRQLADALPHLVWTALPDGRVDFYNQRHREYAGIRQTAHGFEWEPVVHPDDVEATVQAWNRARETGQPYEMEHRVRTAAGNFRWLLSRGLPVRDVDGRVVKWFGTATDIDDLKEAERALAASETRYRALFENMNEGFAVGEPIFDPEGRAVSFRLLQVNRAFARETGLLGPVAGRPIHDVLPRIEPIWIQTFAAVAATGRSTTLTEFNRDTGRYYEVLCFQPVEGRFSVLFRDVSARVRAEGELQRTLAELQRSNADLEQFAFAASHDLKSPLRAIESLAQWLDEDLHDRIDGEHRQHLRLLHQRARRMARLLDDLLAYARAGQADGAEAVDVEVLLAQVRDLLAPSPGIEIRVEKPMPVITTPVAPLRQVFANLLGNAIKHHDRPTGIVRVTASDHGRFIEFCVQDDGPGVPLEFRKRVFAMFQTLRPRDEVDGSGMGLAIVRRTVEALGGTIELASAPSGRGTLVRFLWPKLPPTAPSTQRTGEPPDGQDSPAS